MKKLLFLSLFAILIADSEHLVFNRIVILPDNAELISIYNPTESTISLEDYYISDSNDYYKIQTENDNSPGSFINDFMAKFPDATEIASLDSLILTLRSDYQEFYGEDFTADLVLMEDMLETESGSFGLDPNDRFDDTQECLILFYWNGNSDSPVQDVDYFVWGYATEAVDKSNVEGYLLDTPPEEQDIFNTIHDDYYSFYRVEYVENEEEGGNGISTHDETSELFNTNWGISAIPFITFGCTDETACNYSIDAEGDDDSCLYIDVCGECGGENTCMGCTDENACNYSNSASLDDGSCFYSTGITTCYDDADSVGDYVTPIDVNLQCGEICGTYGYTTTQPLIIYDIIHNCGDEMGESLECEGQYDLSDESVEGCPLYDESLTTTGLLVYYFDITPYDGPHSFTIEDKSGYRIDFVVWPESSTYQNGFDITQSNLNVLTLAPNGIYLVEITGKLGAYCDDDEILDIYNEWQVTVEYEYDINIITSQEDFIPGEINQIHINPAPYVIIPTLNESLDFTFTVYDHSRAIVRIFDLSGRFITSLIDEYFYESGTSPHIEDSAWDGRNHLGQIVAPGTYLLHLEVSNFATGETQTDIAPIVVGVRP